MSRHRRWPGLWRRAGLLVFLIGLTGIVLGGGAGAGPARHLILVPIDDRPAVGQFAQMIGAVADDDVEMPPAEMLGNFTTPGRPEAIADWLLSPAAGDRPAPAALLVSVDMIAYGGLVASRTHAVPLDEARRRLDLFPRLKARYPGVPIYAFSVIMRVAPAASHDSLARWAELKDRVPKTGDAALVKELEELTRQLGPAVLADYLAARQRNLEINLAALALRQSGVIDELILLQDDARAYGLHRQDQAVLRTRLAKSGLERSVPIYNGTDEGSLSLVSRAILARERRTIRVAVVYSSEKSREVIAPYEDHPLQFTVENQVRASGATLVPARERADYRLFIHAPSTTPAEYQRFEKRLIGELKAGRAVALADLLFPAPHYSGADERLVRALVKAGVVDRLTGYAAWNTAGNTLGTAIPHANLRRLAVGKDAPSPIRRAEAEVAHLQFLLNRFAGDYLYHDLVRPVVNQRLREAAAQESFTLSELTPERRAWAERSVAEDLEPRMEAFFRAHFLGRRYPIDRGRQLTVTGLREVKVTLPWARTFECRIDGRIESRVEERRR
ncbi:MAG: DUF4127 family protein [Blastocatellia bacterium]